MHSDFAPLSHISLAPRASYAHPPIPPEEVTMESPAIDVMTDFGIVFPVTTHENVTIDDALEHMKTAGVRLLLVTSPEKTLIGIVTAKNIQGEQPVKVAEESRISRADIRVADIMTRQKDLTVLNLISVRNARVGHIVSTLNQLERQHMLVVEVDQETRAQRLRGLFSTSQITKQVGHDVTHGTGAAHSLAEIVHSIR